MSPIPRVLVTGAHGFLGTPVVEQLLERGFEVHAAGRQRRTLPPGAIGHCVDLLEGAAPARLVGAVRPTHLLHLAWCTEHGRFWSDASNLDWVATSLNLVRAFAAQGGRRAVFAGTCAEYDWTFDRLDESATPLAPRSLYGTSKNALHQMLRAAATGLGLSMAWGRIFFLYGPHEAPGRLIPSITRALLRGDPAPCSDGRQQRDFLHVQDAAAAFAAALGSDFEGAFNVASGTCVPVRSIAQMLGTMTGRAELIRFGQRPTPVDEPERLAATVQILRERIGFEPRYDLASGLAATVDWWRSQLAEA